MQTKQLASLVAMTDTRPLLALEMADARLDGRFIQLGQLCIKLLQRCIKRIRYYSKFSYYSTLPNRGSGHFRVQLHGGTESAFRAFLT